MAEPTPQGGCLGLIMLLLAPILFFVPMQSSSVTMSPPTEAVGVVAGQITFVLEVAEPDQTMVAVEVIERRLAGAGLGTYTMGIGGGQIEVSFDPRLYEPETLIGLLTSPGTLAVVDMTGIVNPQDYVGASLALSEGPAVGEFNPLTGEPFEQILSNEEGNIVSAYAEMGDFGPHIVVELSDEGALQMRAISEARIGEPMGITINGELLIAPIVQDQIGGEFLITGNFTMSEAESLAAQLSTEPLPVEVRVLEIIES